MFTGGALGQSHRILSPVLIPCGLQEFVIIKSDRSVFLFLFLFVAHLPFHHAGLETP